MKNEKILIGVVFVFVILLMVFASAQYSKSFPQTLNPGISSSFLRSQGISVFPAFDDNMCEIGQDFLVQIAPFGCTPSVVRSDLLEEQNVPVFCQLSATQFNPLIDVKAIDRISFKGQYPKEVSGIGFYPASAAVRSSNRALLNSPILENIGYVVIVLRQQPIESKMPDFVQGNLTAFLRYDIENAFGIGKATLYLPELNAQQWSEKFQQYGFWNGQAYLRTEGIEKDRAIVSVYTDEFNRVSSFNLRKGQISDNVYLPGLFCTAGLKLRLDGLENPDTRARININGQVVEVADDERFLQNECTVRNIEKRGINQGVDISCRTDNGFERFELRINQKVSLSIDGEEKEVGVGNFLYKTGDNPGDKSVYVGHIGTKGDSNDEKDLFVYFVSLPRELTLNKNNLTESELSSIAIIVRGAEMPGKTIGGFLTDFGEAVIAGTLKTFNYLTKGETYDKIFLGEEKGIGNKKVKLIGLAGPTDRKFGSSNEEEKLKENYENAISDYRKIIDSFPSESYSQENIETFGEKALIQAIKVSKNSGQNRKSLELCQEFEERYPKSNLEPTICGNSLKISNSGVSEFAILINGKIKVISLEGISEPTLDEYSAEVLVRKPDGKTTLFQMRKNQIIYLNDEKTEFIQLISLDKDSARFNVNLNPRLEVGAILRGIVTSTRTLKKDFSDGFGSNYVFSLAKINLKKVAKVTVLPNIENAGTEANFTFRIGIEKRAIQLSPDEINDRIENLDRSIEKWEDTSKTLGVAVKGFNAACLTTGAYLTAKNFLNNLDGESIARKEVMRGDGGYTDFCKAELAKKDTQYNSLDDCFFENRDAINSDVKIVAGIIASQGAIKDDNLCGELKTIIGDLGNEVTNGNTKGNERTLTISEDIKKAFTKENSDGECDQVSLTQARDLKKLNSILFNSDISPSLEAASKSSRYNILSNIDSNVRGFATYSSYADEVNKDPALKDVRVRSYGGDKSIKGIYDGGVSVDKKGDIPKDSRVQAIVYKNEKYLLVLEGGRGNEFGIVSVHKPDGVKISDDDSIVKEIKGRFTSFKEFDKTSYENKILNPEVKYFETSPYKGRPASVPFDLKNGWYAAAKQTLGGIGGSIRSYDESGRVSSLWICNVGENGKVEFNQGSLGIGDDQCRQYNPGIGSIQGEFPGLEKSESNKLVSRAISAIEEASRQYSSGVSNVIINGQRIKVGKPAVDVPDIQCQDLMSPEDCLLLFNTCDPVVCPSSRCNLGGNYYVADVAQSGIVGSTLLCLPNVKEGIAVPVCLTGIKAGIDSLTSVQKNYRECLQENLNSGKTIGICDEIHSIYLCDFFWEQAAPLSQIAIPKIFEFIKGESSPRGGGEYAGVQSAWQNAQNSVDYITQYYGGNSFSAFKARATEGIGKAVCRNFVSATYPTDFGFDSLIEPRSPPQYTAWFSESTFTTATVPPISQYKVFYHIYAGENNVQTQGAFYSVFLRDPQGTSFYQTNPTLTIASGFIAKGDFASETIDFTAPTGYQELCIRVNAQESCGYKRVTTEFALNYINDQYLKEQASQTNINSEVTCVSGTSSLYSLVNPNLQAGLGDVVNPNLYNQGIVRVCSSDNPGKGTDALAGTKSGRWQEVGTCDDGRGQIKCYIDTKSVKDQIKTISIEDETLEDISNSISEKLLEERKIVDKEIKEIEDETDPNKIIARITNELIGKAYLNIQKAKLYLLRGDAYAEIVKGLIDKIVKKRDPGAARFPLDVGEEERWTIETAIVELASRQGSYSDNEDLIDKFYRDGLLTDAEYAEINGGTLYDFNLEEDMDYVRGILAEKSRKSADVSVVSCGDCMKENGCTETECIGIGPNCIFTPNQELGGFAPLPEGTCEEAKIDELAKLNCNKVREGFSLSVEFSECISASGINNILLSSPAKGTGDTFVSLGIDHNIDPIIALAFFKHESNFGTLGQAKSSKSIGNIRYSSTCPGNDINGFCAYESWEDSIKHWYELISGSVYVGSGLDSVEEIIPKYAPTSDGNDVSSYIRNVRDFVIENREETFFGVGGA